MWPAPERTGWSAPPMVVAFACVAVGIVVGDGAAGVGSMVWFFGAAVCALIAWWPHRAVRVGGMCLAAAALGAGHGTSRLHEGPADRLVLGDQAGIVVVEGVVAEPPAVGRAASGALAPRARFNPARGRFALRLTGVVVDGVVAPARGVLRCSVDLDEIEDGMLLPLVGAHVRVTARAWGVGRPMNPGGFEPRRWARDRGVVGWGRVASASLIEPARGSLSGTAWLGARWHEWTGVVRARAAGALDGTMDESGALGAAILLGSRSPALDEVGDALARTGAAHLVAISGLHLGIVAGFVVLAVRLTGDRPRVEALALLVLACAAIVVIPARPPIMRAAVMVAAYALTEVCGRRYDRLNMLAVVAIGVVMWRPSELFNPGYQLSFGVVAGLVTLVEPMRERVFGPRPDPDTVGWRGRVVSWVRSAVIVGVVAWAIATPITAYHFGTVSPIGVVSSLVLLPFAGAALALGYPGLIAAVVSETVSGALLTASGWALDAMAWVARWMDALPGTGFTIAPIDPVYPLVAPLVIAWVIRADVRRRVLVPVVALLVAWPAGVSWWTGRTAPGVAAELITLSVGDGTCHILRSGTEAMMFDAGSSRLGVGLDDIPRAARAVGAPRIPVAAISHPDLDHFSGLLDAARSVRVHRVVVTERFLENGAARPDGAAALVLETLGERGVEVEVVRAGATLEIGRVRAELVHPPPDLDGDLRDASDNDTSAVWRVIVPTEAGERVILLTGDLADTGIAALRAGHPGLRADVLEVPHHGSFRPVAESFVHRLDPAVAIQSTGLRRLGDERWDRAKAGRRWLITARDGAVTTRVLRDGRIEAVGYAEQGSNGGGG
ncbi:MAG: ComEC/Rec2 family competence protein [Planctomycetota bacterium]